jgi:hypothetical protein
MQQKYIEYVPGVLLVFQHIEEAIRQYLLRCEAVTAARLHGITKYRISNKGIDKLSLGRLVDKFEKVNGNDGLIKELGSIIVERNFFAHQSYIALFGKEGNSKDIQEIESLYERAVKAKESAEKCFWDLLKEIEILEKNFTEIQRKSTEHVTPTDG